MATIQQPWKAKIQPARRGVNPSDKSSHLPTFHRVSDLCRFSLGGPATGLIISPNNAPGRKGIDRVNGMRAFSDLLDHSACYRVRSGIAVLQGFKFHRHSGYWRNIQSRQPFPVTQSVSTKRQRPVTQRGLGPARVACRVGGGDEICKLGKPTPHADNFRHDKRLEQKPGRAQGWRARTVGGYSSQAPGRQPSTEESAQASQALP